MLDDEEITRVLCVTAHPDDVDFGAAGTVATLTSRGVEVAYVVATDGQAGGFDRDVPRSRIPEIRRAEQRAAAAEVGVEKVTFLGLSDGEVEVSQDLRRALARQIRRLRPDVVITTTPERNYRRIGISHPDHRAVGEATLCAVYPDARNEFAFPELLAEEGLEPHVVREVWLQGDEQADHAVDVTGVIDRKLAAIGAHASQVRDPDRLEERVREWLSASARAHGLGEDRLAEVFRRCETG